VDLSTENPESGFEFCPTGLIGDYRIVSPSGNWMFFALESGTSSIYEYSITTILLHSMETGERWTVRTQSPVRILDISDFPSISWSQDETQLVINLEGSGCHPGEAGASPHGNSQQEGRSSLAGRARPPRPIHGTGAGLAQTRTPLP